MIQTKTARRPTLKTKRNRQRNGSPYLFAKPGRAYGIIDLFCGTGGFSHGFASFDPRFRLLGAIDAEADPAATTQANHPDCQVVRNDIRLVRPSDMKSLIQGQKVDVIIGGPPCQGFSSLRPFRSSDDEDPRNNLFEQFALYVNYFKPRVFVMENVLGLLTYENGATLDAIQQCFARMGYRTDWRILNAACFGVPQKRERFIMIGRRGNRPIAFPKPTHRFDGRGIGYKDKSRMLVGNGDLPSAVTTIEAIGDLPSVRAGEEKTRYTRRPTCEYQMERRVRAEKLTLHLATNHNPQLLEVIKHSGDSISTLPKGLVSSGFSSCYSRLDPNLPANTITVKFTSPASSKCIHPFQDRAITPREAARIQSFDDDYVFCGSKTSVAYQIGNAVPPLLGKAIAKPVLEMLDA
jgi:DNA (cytosine-5)-methyltransferase 1